ncbi:hypothetical protein D3C77_692490 [compost metagenome]
MACGTTQGRDVRDAGVLFASGIGFERDFFAFEVPESVRHAASKKLFSSFHIAHADGFLDGVDSRQTR